MARLAESLDMLRREVDARAPQRNRDSDGWIGNAAHAATASDHNPNTEGVVCALDITNDPDNGCDVAVFADYWRQHPHPDIKYVILHTERRMFSAYEAHGVPPFTWRPYSGGAAAECHVSVGVGRDGHSEPPYDDTVSWFAANTVQQPVAPEEPPAGTSSTDTGGTFTVEIYFAYLRRDDKQQNPSQRVANVQALCNAHGATLKVDGLFGPNTEDTIRWIQSRENIDVDGIVGPDTLNRLLA